MKRAVNAPENGKAEGIVGVLSKVMKYGGEADVEWAWKVCMAACKSEHVPNDLRKAVTCCLKELK